jgi:hypothetical protein
MTAKAIALHPSDNVATALSDIEAGDLVVVGAISLKVVEVVPFGHKVALRPIPAGNPILKYGECIGIAKRDIPVGGYVHVENVESQRGRGDLRGPRQ